MQHSPSWVRATCVSTVWRCRRHRLSRRPVLNRWCSRRRRASLINGTDGMLAMLMLACTDLERLARTADLTAAMSLEALLGTDRVLAEDLMAMRPHPGQAAAAANMR